MTRIHCVLKQILQMGRIKRAIMDEIGESFGVWRSAITGDKSYPLSVISRLMTNPGLELPFCAWDRLRPDRLQPRGRYGYTNTTSSCNILTSQELYLLIRYVLFSCPPKSKPQYPVHCSVGVSWLWQQQLYENSSMNFCLILLSDRQINKPAEPIRGRLRQKSSTAGSLEILHLF